MKYDDLTTLAIKHGTDKWGTHWYTQHYNHHFARFRPFKFNLLEIGVGGYDNPEAGGESLRTWEEYFPLANVIGLDYFDKAPHSKGRVFTIHGDQTDEECLQRLHKEFGPFDIIVDDGSHLSHHVIKSFEVLFPLLNDGGIYAIEDTQTSYWPHFGGDARDFNKKSTTLGRAKSLTDGLNFKEIPDPDYKSSYTDKHIIGMHFYHSLVLIDKGLNSEESTAVINNQPTHVTGGPS